MAEFPTKSVGEIVTSSEWNQIGEYIDTQAGVVIERSLTAGNSSLFEFGFPVREIELLFTGRCSAADGAATGLRFSCPSITGTYTGLDSSVDQAGAASSNPYGTAATGRIGGVASDSGTRNTHTFVRFTVGSRMSFSYTGFRFSGSLDSERRTHMGGGFASEFNPSVSDLELSLTGSETFSVALAVVRAWPV